MVIYYLFFLLPLDIVLFDEPRPLDIRLPLVAMMRPPIVSLNFLRGDFSPTTEETDDDVVTLICLALCILYDCVFLIDSFAFCVCPIF